MDDDKGTGYPRRKLQAQRADEEGGHRQRRQREAAARAQLDTSGSTPAQAAPRAPSAGGRSAASGRERLARVPSSQGDKALAKGRPVTRGRASVRGGMHGQRGSGSH